MDKSSVTSNSKSYIQKESNLVSYDSTDPIALDNLTNNLNNNDGMNSVDGEIESYMTNNYQIFEEEEEERFDDFENNININNFDDEEIKKLINNMQLNDEEEENFNITQITSDTYLNDTFTKTEEEDSCTLKINSNNETRNIYSEEEEDKNIFKMTLTNETHNIHDSGKEHHISCEFDNINSSNRVNSFLKSNSDSNHQSFFSEKEEEEEEAEISLEIQATNHFHQANEEEEEEDSFIFETTDSNVKPNYIDDDHVDLITDNDEDTIKLFKKLDNMDLDLSKIENPSDDNKIEEEEEEGDQNQFQEEEEKKDDVFSLSNYDMTMDQDTKELFDVINKLQIDKLSEKEKPLQIFDPAIVNEELSTKDHFVEKQFNFQDSFVYRDVEADMKPFKQRGNKRNVYQDLHSFDCAALVIDPSTLDNEINNYTTPNFNKYDEAAIITARTEDAPIPEYEILTQYPGEMESLILQAYLDFNDL
ncbi:hypothetical protein M9Y10_015217 [Tritrichomonas musculus]|uniref:Uncharacterized protein n=1 Tax=Tritrichomonas musculus TaxID=1915356 RepID=A0ABR2L1Q0_9EUKA